MPRRHDSSPAGRENAGSAGLRSGGVFLAAGPTLSVSLRLLSRAALALGLAGLLIFEGGAALAAEQIPSSVDPGQIDKRLRELPALREREGPEIQRPEIAPGAAPKAETVFVLRDVKVEGATVYSPAEFRPLYQDLIGREVRLSDIDAVAKRITGRYQEDGYVLSRAMVPEQTPADGVATVRVVEGYVSQVSIEGDVKGDKDLLADYGNKITADRPTRTSNLERYVLLISDLPGVTIRPFLEPINVDSGEYKLILAMQHRSFVGSAQVDNRGSNFIGPYEFWLGAGFNSLLGLYESTHLQFVTTPNTGELLFGGGSYTQPIGSEGTTATASISYNKSAPGFTLSPIDIHSHALSGDLQLAYPVIRSRKLDVYATGRFSYRDSSSDHGNTRAFDDRLRVIRAGGIVSFNDDLSGRDWLSAEVSQGLSFLGASKSNSLDVSTPGADAGFTKFTLDFSRYQRVGEDWGVLALATGQKATGPLLSPEQIGLGGERFGRAYDAAEIAGADGLAGRAELQRDFWPNDFAIAQLQLYTFYDIGSVWTPGQQTLSSVGAGVRAQFAHGFFAYVEGAKPLTRSVLGEGNKDPRFFFVVRSDF